MCHCHACQRRTGSAFGLQAGYQADQARIEGRSREYVRTSTEPDRRVHAFPFCPECGSTVYYTEADAPEFVTVMVGAFADPEFPPPTVSVYGVRRHRWLALPERIEHDEVWSELQSLYGAGEYAAAANPLTAQLIYNVECCESMAGRAGDAIEHLRQAIAIGPRPAPGDGGRGLRPGRDPRRAGLPGAAHLGSPRPGWGERRGGRERMRSPVE